MKSKLGFQKQLVVGFTLIALLSITISGAVSYFFTSNLVNRLTLSNLTSQISGIQSAIDVSFQDNKFRQDHLMNSWSHTVLPRVQIKKEASSKLWALDPDGNQKELLDVPGLFLDGHPLKDSNLVDKIANETGGVSTLFVRTSSGFFRVSTNIKNKDGNRAIGTLLDYDSTAGKSLLEGKRFIGRNKILGESYISVYEPIVRNEEVLGAFFIGIKDTSGTYLKNYIKQQKLLDTGYFYILDPTGLLLSHPTKQGENVIESVDLDGQKIFKKILEQKNGIIYYRWFNVEIQHPQNKLAVFHYFPEMDWVLAASINVEETEVATHELRRILFFISAVMTFGMASITAFFGHRMALKLHQISKNLQKSSSQVDKSAVELTSVSSTLAQSSIEQAASLQETMSAMEEISSMVSRNLEASQSTAQLSTQMEQEAQTGKQILEELKSSVQSIANANQEVGLEAKASQEAMKRIVEVISSIESKTQVINDIVFQTKLLSFNASVEAARAGEHGKGFAVVAEEVGTLASLSGKAAEEIRGSLEESRSQVDQIVSHAQTKMSSLTNQADRATQEGVEITQKCGQVFEGIIAHIAKANLSVQGIAEASKEQNQGIIEINKAMGQLDQVTQQNSLTAQQVSGLADGLGNNASDMQKSVKDLRVFMSGQSEECEVEKPLEPGHSSLVEAA